MRAMYFNNNNKSKLYNITTYTYCLVVYYTAV